MDVCVDDFLKNLYLYEQKKLTLSGKCYRYLDLVRESIESVLIIKVACQDRYTKDDLESFPTFLSDLYINTHTSHFSHGLCYVYHFWENYNFFTSVLDRTQESYCNAVLFNNYVLKNIALQPQEVVLDISELLDRYHTKKR